MARHARIHYSGGIYHLISRCVGKQYLIGGRSERQKYLELLGRAAAKTDAIILAYCVMSSHTHLVVRAGNEPLWRLMKAVNAGFAVWLNNRSGGKRDGAVFSQRYKSILVDEEAYLLQLVRYVHNNPVRAKVVKNAADSKWSSHRMYVGLDAAPEWLNSGYVLSMLNKTPGWARRQFERFVEEGKTEGRRTDLCGEEPSTAARRFQQDYGDAWRISGPIVGDDQFAARVLADIAKVDEQNAMSSTLHKVHRYRRPTLDELIAVVCSHVDVEPWAFDHQPKCRTSAMARRLIVFLWVAEFGGTQSDVARKLKVSSPAVSKWYSHAVSDLPNLEGDLDIIKKRFLSYLEGADTSAKTRVLLEFK